MVKYSEQIKGTREITTKDLSIEVVVQKLQDQHVDPLSVLFTVQEMCERIGNYVQVNPEAVRLFSDLPPKVQHVAGFIDTYIMRQAEEKLEIPESREALLQVLPTIDELADLFNITFAIDTTEFHYFRPTTNQVRQ
jgi:hypothetical protein